ncbi:RNA polymerase II-associated protein 3 [Momordica charantia]|uniref:RNA polymerase II-associated protein 3 n=1 Tax=Momordica charantia TaxID=3673 RepID=A0A6J1CA02_MOMCH|nr:RNA polymerase II-associated protein 3 [Momordica charantia]
MAEASATGNGGGGAEASLKDKGNEFFKAGNYLKAAALYTQAIKLDPSNHALYSNRAAAFLHLVKLNKALADAEMTIKLNPQWEKGYFRKGCILEAMEKYDDALSAFQTALQYNPQSAEVSKKIKRVSQLVKDKKRAQEVENKRSNIDMTKHLEKLKSELSEKYGSEDRWKDIFSFVIETMEGAVRSWHETSNVDAKMYFLLDKEKTDTEKYAPVVNIDKAFESPHTHSDCFQFLRKYAEDSVSQAACLVTPKSLISYPQVWKGQGSRKWKHGQHDGFFIQLEAPLLRKLWFVPSSSELGRPLCRDPEVLDISAHELLPRIFK